MTFSHFFQKVEEISPHQKKLTALAEFIQTKENAEILFGEDKKGGEIDFSTLCNKSDNLLTHFDSQNTGHREFLNDVIEDYQVKLKKLQTIDFKLALSFTIGIAAIALAPLTFGFSAIISAVAFSYFGYQYHKREQVQENYKQAQLDMTNTYIWVMNDTQNMITKEGKALPRQDNMTDEQFAKTVNDNLSSEVKNMHKTFNPILSDQDIWHYTRNSLDTAITVDRNVCNEESVKNETTTKLQLSLNYLLYGQNQGTPLSITKGLFIMLGQSLWSMGVSIKDGILSMIGMNEEQVVEKVVETATNVAMNTI